MSAETFKDDISDIVVRACKFDGTEHRRWHARLLDRDDSLITLDARFDSEIRHDLLGTILRGTISVEYYWLDRWYNVFRFMYPAGGLQCFYCNVNVPPVLHDGVLSYIDLDIDILVTPELSFTILDEDEFATHAERYRYPEDVIRNCYQARDQLVAMIRERAFPFDSLI